MKAKSVWKIMVHDDSWSGKRCSLTVLSFVVFPQRAMGAIEKSVIGK